MADYFASDLHFGHEKVAKLRRKDGTSMMSEIETAKSFLSDAEESAGTTNGRVLNHLAQTHALIAIAEQLRIANLVQLMNVSEDTACVDAIYMTAQGGRWKLHPEIAEALGIEKS